MKLLSRQQNKNETEIGNDKTILSLHFTKTILISRKGKGNMKMRLLLTYSNMKIIPSPE